MIYNKKIERVWVGIGSNLHNPKNQIDRAVWALSVIPNTTLIACSSCYRSVPLGNNKCQPDFLNMVVILDTFLFPEDLLSHMQYIEWQQGRIRDVKYKWQSRTLDLDILLFGNNVIYNNLLIVPHYDIFNREFVIYPLFELDSNLILPGGSVVQNLVKVVPKNGLILCKNYNSY